MSRLMTKPTMWLCAQRRLRSAWASTQSDQSLHCPLGSLAPHWAHSEDSDQTGRMPRLIWVFAGRTVILLVLSWGGPIIINVFFQTEQVPAELTKAKSLSSLSPLTLKVVGPPQMTYQQWSHGITFPCLLLPSGNFRPHSCPFFDVTCIFTTLFWLPLLLIAIPEPFHMIFNNWVMRVWYLSHRWPAKAQAIRAVWPEPSLFAHMKYESRRRVRPKIRHLAPRDGCACAFEEWLYRGRKVL